MTYRRGWYKFTIIFKCFIWKIFQGVISFIYSHLIAALNISMQLMRWEAYRGWRNCWPLRTSKLGEILTKCSLARLAENSSWWQAPSAQIWNTFIYDDMALISSSAYRDIRYPSFYVRLGRRQNTLGGKKPTSLWWLVSRYRPSRREGNNKCQ